MRGCGWGTIFRLSGSETNAVQHVTDKKRKTGCGHSKGRRGPGGRGLGECSAEEIIEIIENQEVNK